MSDKESFRELTAKEISESTDIFHSLGLKNGKVLSTNKPGNVIRESMLTNTFSSHNVHGQRSSQMDASLLADITKEKLKTTFAGNRRTAVAYEIMIATGVGQKDILRAIDDLLDVDFVRIRLFDWISSLNETGAGNHFILFDDDHTAKRRYVARRSPITDEVVFKSGITCGKGISHKLLVGVAAYDCVYFKGGTIPGVRKFDDVIGVIIISSIYADMNRALLSIDFASDKEITLQPAHYHYLDGKDPNAPILTGRLIQVVSDGQHAMFLVMRKKNAFAETLNKNILDVNEIMSMDIDGRIEALEDGIGTQLYASVRALLRIIGKRQSAVRRTLKNNTELGSDEVDEEKMLTGDFVDEVHYVVGTSAGGYPVNVVHTLDVREVSSVRENKTLHIKVTHYKQIAVIKQILTLHISVIYCLSHFHKYGDLPVNINRLKTFSAGNMSNKLNVVEGVSKLLKVTTATDLIGVLLEYGGIFPPVLREVDMYTRLLRS